MSKTHNPLVCAGFMLQVMHLHTASGLLSGTVQLSTSGQVKSRRQLALAFVLKSRPGKEDVAKNMLAESREYMVNNKLMSANEVDELLSSSGCDLLCPSQSYPDFFRRGYRTNSYETCVFKASALKIGVNYIPFRSKRLEVCLLRKKQKSESETSLKSTVDLNSAVNNISKGISYVGISSAIASGTYVLSTVLSGVIAAITARK
jgi:hypothetical protein